MPNTNKWLDEIGLTYLVLKIKSLFNKKVDKVEGKGLSSEDYTTSEKIKLGSIENGAQVNKVTGVKGNSESSYRTGNINITKANIGLSNAENKSSETIRGEITEKNIIDALGYAPPKQDTTYVAATTTDAGLMSAADKTKLNGIASGANKYTHPTTSGNKHIPSGGSSGKILRWSADGTAVWGDDNNTDTKVLQSSTTTGNYRPILMGANNDNDISTLEESVTGQSYQSSKIFAQPSTGTFYAGNLTVRNDGYVTLTDGGSINQKQPDPTTSRYSSIVKWVPNTASAETYVASIGRHNSGGDATDKGAITILPYNTSTDPWTGDVGLYIKKGYVSIDGSELVKKSTADSTYAAKDHTHSYLPLSGGTISSSTFGPLIIERTGSTNHAAIRFKNSNGILGSISMNTVDGNLVKYNADTTSAKTILDSGNFKSTVTPSAIGALPLTGGVMTGNIKYKTETRTSALFMVDDGDANGSLYTGPHTGGLTVIGAGESPVNIRTAVLSEDGFSIPCTASSKFSAASESLILSADTNIYFIPNCQTIANRKPAMLSSELEFTPGTTETGSIGTSTYKWNTMYANTFYGSLSGNSSTTTKWANARNINGLSVDGSANRVNYGSCSTAAATAAKTVSCTGFALVTGAEITVKFTVTNTAVNPTLNVNSTGAKSIYYRNAAITASYLAANRTYTFRYNGTQYELVGDLNTNTDTKVTVTAINVTASSNNNIVRPLLFAASNANINNEHISVEGTSGGSSLSKATTYTGGINMTPGVYLETSNWTSGGSGGYSRLCAESFKTLGSGSFFGNLSGNANSADTLKNARKINGVPFNGSIDISITKCLYNGTGATTVTLTESQSNYDLLIIITDKGTFLHEVGSGYSFHSFNTYPTPSQGGTGYVNLCNFSINDQTDKKIISVASKVDLKGSGSTATSNSTTNTVLIKEVYGLKLSAT